MNRTPQTRVLIVLVALALGLGLTAPSALALTGRAPAVQPRLAEETAASASDFLFYKDATAPLCVGPVTLNVSDAPYFTREDCGNAAFTLSGTPGTVTAKLFSGDSTTAFATPTVTGTTADRDVALEPDETWPAGPVRLEIYDGTTLAGSSSFFFNTLVAEVDPVADTAPGQGFTVAGTLSEVDIDSSLSGTTFTGVPGAFTLKVLDAGGQQLHSMPVTAGSDGAFSANVPGSATAAVDPGPESGFTTALGLRVVDASYDDPSTGEWAADDAGAGSVTLTAPPNGLVLENSFVSSVGWVKPGEDYPSRLIVRNYDATPSGPVTVTVGAPDGARFTGFSGPGTHPDSSTDLLWTIPSVPAASGTGPGIATLVVSWRADTLAEDATIVWKDLSSTANLSTAGQDTDDTSHGPKVIPPAGAYDSARYGDRPFPIVPVDYLDRKHQADHSGEGLATKINSPAVPGSTFNLFQEMSLGQLFPQGDVPSSGIATKDFAYDGGFPFTGLEPAGTCRGITVGSDAAGTPLYPERIKDGFYQLPGTTDYYGDDKFGSAVVGSQTPIGALADLDSACGPTAKLVWDAAAIADPEIDYSDFDTDKDGVVDFFMVVFVGCGGNGVSQVPSACPYGAESYDNVWPHSSSLEGTYTDPETGLAGFTTDDQLKDLEGRPLWYTDTARTEMTTDDKGDDLKVFVRVGPYNVNPETAIDKASVISHEYGHSLGLPDFYTTSGRETYGDWTLMAEDKSQNIDAFGRQELGWVVPQVLDGDRTVTGMKDSKEDTDSITWRKPNGDPYTLTETPGGARVQNSEMYVAKLPGRRLITEADFDTGEKASKTHAWWSGSGNDFGCSPDGGRNLDLAVPGLADLPEGTTLSLEMKSRFDIEWDYDYGFVLTTKDGGETYTSAASNRSGNITTTPAATNPNQNACQAKYGNGITGSSASYRKDPVQLQADRLTAASPSAEFLADSFDISDLVGAPAGSGALRFSYSTDPGLARPGWFIDDLKVVATLPGDGGTRTLLETDFEGEGGPEDFRVFNGGCQENVKVTKQCTKGWSYVDASSESPADHAYYLEMRDRSGFDEDSKGENDRSALAFQPGLYVAYTDETHGYGNVGTDDPPAQSPLDSQPVPGESAPDLGDAAWTAADGDSTFTDSGEGHTDNYTDPSNSDVDSRYPDVPNPWRFRFGCLTFDVTSLSGTDVGPSVSDGNLTGDVVFDMGAGCGAFDYGYGDLPAPPDNTSPTADATANPTAARTGQEVQFDATGSTDAEDPSDLDYSWDFDGNGTKDSSAVSPKHAYSQPGTYTAKLTVTDPQGLDDKDTVQVTVTASGEAPSAKASASPTRTRTGRQVTFSGQGSSDEETASDDLTYSWSFGNGGSTQDATGRTVKFAYARPGTYTARLTVTDEDGGTDTDTVRVAVGVVDQCESASVRKNGDWTVRRTDGGLRYCTGAKPASTLVMPTAGDRLELWFGKARNGGRSKVYVDGELVGRIDHDRAGGLRFGFMRVFTGLGAGNHRVVVKPAGGRAWIDYDVFYARRS